MQHGSPAAIAVCGIADRWSAGLGIVYPLVVIRT